ncbi:PREDICTED: uncharacterized protein LOC101810705 [Ficedula albicollis]|uniref:uncharacterized protein LOC101810705 n=1 Tax=Ficedula albicollis TaxID=59894 RepID=UPI000359514F|nr:PREDICTED: uncharacterized protein LOC101810705 [Ficedula albicollis]
MYIQGSHLALPPPLAPTLVCGRTPLAQLPRLLESTPPDVQQLQVWPVRMSRGQVLLADVWSPGCKELPERGSRGVIPGSLSRSDGESISRGLGSTCNIAQRGRDGAGAEPEPEPRCPISAADAPASPPISEPGGDLKWRRKEELFETVRAISVDAWLLRSVVVRMRKLSVPRRKMRRCGRMEPAATEGWGRHSSRSETLPSKERDLSILLEFEALGKPLQHGKVLLAPDMFPVLRSSWTCAVPSRTGKLTYLSHPWQKRWYLSSQCQWAPAP